MPFASMIANSNEFYSLVVYCKKKSLLFNYFDHDILFHWEFPSEEW